MMTSVSDMLKLEREFPRREEQTVSHSQISLEAVIELAARELEQSGEVGYKTDQQEDVYEEMNFNGRNDNDNDDEYMEMNFRRL